MKNTFNYTSRTGNVLSEQLQLLWRYAMVMVAVFAFSANANAQDPRCDANPADWPALLNAPGSTHITDVANATDNSDNQFTQGAKDEDTWLTAATKWHWSLGSANDKGDIQNAGAALVNDCVLRFFGDRTAVNGDASIGFWFFQDPNISLNANGTFNGTRTNGDIFVLVDFLGGGGTAVPKAYVWHNGGLIPLVGATACGTSNSGAIATSDIPWDYDPKTGSGYAKGAFFEGYVDLCGTGLDLCFSTFLVETRNSQELTAALQDFAFGSIDITPLQPLATATDITCEDEQSIITVTDPEIGLTYVLDGPGIGDPIEITPTAINPDVEFTVNEVGTYSLIAENSNGCQSDPYEVVVDADITPIGAPVVTDQERCGPGTVTFTVSSPLNGVTYRWYNSAGVLVQTGPSYTTGSLSVTTDFTVTATSANGCESIPTDIQAIIFPPVIVEAGNPITSCGASPVQLNGSVTGGATTGSWTGGTGSFNPSRNVLNPIYTPSAAEIEAGTVTLTLTSANPDGPCPAENDAVTITINEEVVVDAGDDVTVCSDDPDVTLAGSISGGITTGAWVGGTGTFTPGRSALNAVYTPSAAEITAGTVTLTLQSDEPAGPCEAKNNQMIITINPAVIVDAGGPDTRCQSTSTQVIALTGASITGGANDGTWQIVSSVPANAGNTLGNNTYASGSLTVAANYVGTITLRLTSVNPTGPCEAEADDRIVTIGPAAIVEAGAPITVCQSTSLQNIPLTGASVTGGTSNGTWAIISSVPANAGNTLGDATLATGSLTVAANYYGVITLQLTSADPDGDGPCEAASDTRTVTINQAVTAEAGDNITRCQSTSEQIIALAGASVTGGATTGTWEITSATPSTGVTLTNNTVASGSLTIAANYTGVINLTLTSADPDGAGPCVADTDTRTVTIGPAAVVDAGTPITRCQSATSQAIALTGASITGGANTGTWSIVSSVPANAGNVLSNNTYASGSLTVAANYYGVITLQLTSADPDGAGPCQAAVDTRTVTIYQNPSVMVTAGTSTCINNVPTVTITATPSGGSGTGYTYDWTVPAGAVDPGNVASFSATVAGTYSVIVTDSRTCSGSGSVVPLFVPCEMLEGCTPGYWKQSQHFGNWGCGYVPTGQNATLFSTALGLTSAQMTLRGLPTNLTLLQALNLNGGKFYALARHAAAAILNSCADVNYKYTAAQIRTMVQAAFTSGNPNIAHNSLAAANEMGCPLGRAPLATTSKVKGLQGIETTTDQITAYPTPFSDRAIVEFRMAADENYVVNLYDMKGSLVKQLKAGSAKAGELQQVEVDGKGLGEGLYIARMISDSGARSVKLLLKRE